MKDKLILNAVGLRWFFIGLVSMFSSVLIPRLYHGSVHFDFSSMQIVTFLIISYVFACRMQNHIKEKIKLGSILISFILISVIWLIVYFLLEISTNKFNVANESTTTQFKESLIDNKKA
ncbi:hypothetical protein [Thiomicrorhabdus sp.]|uniref:hypothetical protein n=1 Tax=Thiomicrorhabdus sp. TaxID=2039724 RepID=UPI0029C86C13|nr:hypothetical protein [Thiomicrorhabdus sp.]